MDILIMWLAWSSVVLVLGVLFLGIVAVAQALLGK